MNYIDRDVVRELPANAADPSQDGSMASGGFSAVPPSSFPQDIGHPIDSFAGGGSSMRASEETPSRPRDSVELK